MTLKVIDLPSDEFVPNFANKSLVEVNKWKEENNIIVKTTYEYSDKILKNYVISQDISYPTLVKDVTEINIVLSNGPDYSKEVIVPNFIGMKYDAVMKYIEENFLSNVQFDFVKSEEEKDLILEQEGSGTRKRSDLITLTVSTDVEPSETKIIDLTGKTRLYAENWLKKHGFKVEIKEEYSDTIEQDCVMSQSTVNEVKNPLEDTITLTISKGQMIVVPDLASLSEEERNKWILDNDLKVKYQENYNDEVKLGDIISSSIQKGDTISSGDEIEITISKGNLKMPAVNNINDFSIWAANNNVDYELQYEYSTTIKKDEIIKCSHEKGQSIKVNDTVVITISKGKSITLPNFVGKSKTEIQEKCQSLNLNCTFKVGGYTENTKANICTSQSKSSGTNVAEGTSLVITLSAGIVEKVDVPSFKGKTKNEITNLCKSLGVTCTFKYDSNYSSTAKDVCLSQSKTGKVNKGTSITVTLSKGPAQTYKVVIDVNQLSNGNPAKTKETLEKKLKNNYPGVNFVFKFEKSTIRIGYLSNNSDIKLGENIITQGKTYTVIINSD